MSDKLINLTGATTLYNDLRDRTTELNTKITEYIQAPEHKNYFDKNSQDINVGKYFDKSALKSDPNMSCVLIEVPTSGSYSLLGDTTFFGASGVIKIPCFKKSDGSYISLKWGTLDSSTNIVTISGLNTMTSEDTILIGYTFRRSASYKSFVCSGTLTVLPDFTDLNYTLDEDIFVNEDKLITNLTGKTALFFGDSICDATTVPQADTNYYHWGWAGRVGEANRMTWSNFGNSGGSITNMTGRDCIATTVNNEIANYPNADYIILEGGTNDADVIASGGDYTLGTFDQYDYTSTYDQTTFCGSFETLLRNVISAFPKGKVGYIVAPKMGQSETALETRKELFDVAVNICKKWGVPYIDLWSGCILNPMLSEYYDSTLTTDENIASKYYVDGQHLTDKGYDLVSPLISDWIKLL